MSPARWPALAEMAARREVDWTARAQARIRALDPGLGAFLSLAAADEVPPGEGPLAGVPLAVKDNIAVLGQPLTCASRVLEGHRPAYQATAVERLRAAGARVVGKTNLDEFAMGSSTENSAFFPTRNPWNPAHVPGGSSGGAAAAVAAALVPAAIGSDTGGSVRQPAAYCGAVGFKPSYGAVSRWGLLSYGSSLDQIGVIATRVADAARIFTIIRGPDGRDDTVWPTERFGPPPAKSTLTIGLPRQYADHPELDGCIRAAVADAAARLAERGHRLVEVDLPSLDDTVVPAYYLTAAAEASSNLARYDGIRFGRRSERECWDIQHLLAANRSLFGPEVRRRILLGTFVLRSGYADRFYGKAQDARRRIIAGFDRAFCEVDLLLTPVAPGPAFRLGALVGDQLRMKLADLFTVSANLAGLPAIALPTGLADGLPTAVQLMAPRFGDDGLLAAAAALEEALAFCPEDCPAAAAGPGVQP